MTEKRDKVNVDDIIGLIKTDEPTNSVEEVRKLRGRETEKRFKEYYQGKTIVSVHDTKNNNELVNILQCVDLLNRIADENEQLKQQLSEAKADEKQLGISFMGYKMKLIEVLQKKYDKVKGKTLYADVYTEIAEEMGVDLE